MKDINNNLYVEYLQNLLRDSEISFLDYMGFIESRKDKVSNEQMTTKKVIDLSKLDCKKPTDFLRFIKEEDLNEYIHLFRGRKDAYATRYKQKNGRFGFSPKCINIWNKEKCLKNRDKRADCKKCKNREYEKLTKTLYKNHIMGGEKATAIGIYPITLDSTCYFIVFDFDNHDEDKTIDWEKEVNGLANTCKEFNIWLNSTDAHLT
ncbi:hypothetical protein EDD63_1241 [Breznakia blatticola]|uniref:TOTE conflict system primase domain-containing protein n=1 Tax=Breznakia blatticola TaxID=1754012 RepID=A0A4V3G6W9_9FIRM|nr:hypothetical protein [Breznakia blatticola]TDW16374.1 hypothetical protein EDD63_1241 [Breznakia blatticola]